MDMEDTSLEIIMHHGRVRTTHGEQVSAGFSLSLPVDNDLELIFFIVPVCEPIAVNQIDVST